MIGVLTGSLTESTTGPMKIAVGGYGEPLLTTADNSKFCHLVWTSTPSRAVGKAAVTSNYAAIDFRSS